MYDCIYSILFYCLTLFYPIHLETFLLRSSEQCRVVRRVKRKEKKKRARKGNGAGDSLSRRTRFAYYGDIALRARGAVFAYRYIFLRSTRAKLSSLSLSLSSLGCYEVSVTRFAHIQFGPRAPSSPYRRDVCVRRLLFSRSSLSRLNIRKISLFFSSLLLAFRPAPQVQQREEESSLLERVRYTIEFRALSCRIDIFICVVWTNNELDFLSVFEVLWIIAYR